MVQAISRFFIIILHKHRILLTFRVNCMMILISWIVSGIIAGCLFISPVAYQYEVESHTCAVTRKSFLIPFLASVVIFMIPMITITILYTIIIYHTKQHSYIDPKSGNTLRAKRNIKVFKNIFIYTSILGIGGTPYLISIIMNTILPMSLSFYSISFLFIACASAIGSIAIVFINDQVKTIFCAKILRRRQVTRGVMNIRVVKRNQIVAYCNQTGKIDILPTIN
jgi:hypothetical protein